MLLIMSVNIDKPAMVALVCCANRFSLQFYQSITYINAGVMQPYQGCDLKHVGMHLQFGVTPLYYAASQGSVAVAQLLLDRGADVDAADQVR
jgi:ankyrin repeat protein